MKKSFTIILSALLSMSAWAQEEQKVIIGNVVVSDGTVATGIYAMPIDGSSVELIPMAVNPQIKADNGGTIVGSEFHFVNRNADRQYVYHKFDTNTWQRIGQPEVLEGDFKLGDMAYDEQTNRLWAYFDEEWSNGVHTYSRFGYADRDTKEVTILREDEQTKREMLAVCIGPDNNVYAMDPLSRIWNVDKETGEATVAYRLGMSYWIGEGHYSDTNYSLVYDGETNCFYATLIPADDQRSLLVKVDAETGEVSELGEIGHDVEFGALWISTMSATAVNDAVKAQEENSLPGTFDIQGRHIDSQNHSKGIYIVNGKKAIKR